MINPNRDSRLVTVFSLAIVWCLIMLFASVQNLHAQKKPQPKKYPYTTDSEIQKDVPQGVVTDHVWLDSKVFPGTKRRFSVYVPMQYDSSKPAALMVFQDGHAYLKTDGSYRATVVMDNLIHNNQMPVTIGVFVDPGHKAEVLPEKRGWKPRASNRSFEYDTLSGDYAEFLISEILPSVEKQYNITDDPSGRAICGASSGGICAFTVAWQRPDQFGKVISHIGSFTNIRHGDTYPGMIRKADKKPIRVCLQDGSNDLDNIHGNWPLGNLQMEAALKFKKYDYRFDFGEGKHDGNHGGSILPDQMRWLWRDYAGVEFNSAAMPVIQDAAWRRVGGCLGIKKSWQSEK